MKQSMGIRLDPEDRSYLNKLAEAWGLKPADICRMAIKSLLTQAEANGGRIELPVKYKNKSPTLSEVESGLREFDGIVPEPKKKTKILSK